MFFSQLPNFINTTLPPHEQVTAQEIDNYFRQELIYKRNERMGKRVTELLEANPDKSFFFAFGAGMWNDPLSLGALESSRYSEVLCHSVQAWFLKVCSHGLVLQISNALCFKPALPCVCVKHGCKQ